MYLELAHRENDGITVSLWWDREKDTVAVDLEDARSALEKQTFEVPKEKAWEAYMHPYSYAPMHYIEKPKVFV